MGKVMRLNPVIILLSLSVRGELLGFFGLLLALPLTFLLLTYYRRFLESITEQESSKDS
jgi:predicted PurR-regulated permease PerM